VSCHVAVIALDLPGRDVGSGDFIVQQESRAGAQGTVDDGHVAAGEIRHASDIFRIARCDQDALLATAEVDENRSFFQFLIGKVEIIFLVVILQEVAHADMTYPPPQTFETTHAAEVGEKTDSFRLLGMKQGQSSLKEQVVAPGQEEHPVFGRGAVARFFIIDDMGLQPFLHQPSRKKPFAGDLGGWQSLVVDQGIDHFFIDIEELGYILCR